ASDPDPPLATARGRCPPHGCGPGVERGTEAQKGRDMAAQEEPVDSPVGWVAAHIARYVATNGEEGHLWNGVPTLLLTTRGPRSGQPRRTALIYGRDGDRYLVVASKGGAAAHPLWYLN